MAQANKTLFFVVLFGIFITIPAISRTKRAVSIPCIVKPEDIRFYDTLKSELDGTTKIIEYELHFKNYSSAFWKGISDKEWFKPTRWYYANVDRAERLLLLFHYYYGLLRPLVQIGVRSMDVYLIVEPMGCLQTLSGDQIRNLMYNVVLEKFDLNLNSTEGLPASDNKRACTTHIIDDDGWGKLVYNCCRRLENGDASCDIIADDIWVWVLRWFIISIAIIMFLYFPMFIPTRYNTTIFNYYPPSGLVFNILKTRNPPDNATEAQIVNLKKLRKLQKFCKELEEIPDDIPIHIKVRKMEFSVCYDRLLGENEPPVGMVKLLFNALVRCKIRHSDPLENCCKASVFGEYSCGRGPRWYRLLQVIRTIFVFIILALPAIPLLYNLSDNHLEYKQVAQNIIERRLKQSYNFDVGVVWGKVIVAILSLTYVLHAIVVVIDGAMDQSLGKLYSDLIESSNADVALSERIRSLGRLIKYTFLPIQKFGFFIIPLWLVILMLSPLVLCVYIIFTAPTLKMTYHIISLVKNWIQRRRTSNVILNESRADFAEKILCCVSIISVFVILTIGVDFLLQVSVMFIVNMLINVKLTMRILPLVLLVLFYIKDTFNSVSSIYFSYHKTILKKVLALESDDIKREANKKVLEQESKIFQIFEPVEQTDESTNVIIEEKKKSAKFQLKHKCLRMRTKSLILFLDKDDIPYISKKFFHYTTDIECPGVPGYIEEAVLRAFFDFLKIVLFLAFILFIVMAYGDSNYISPSGQFFATFISGMIPFILRKFFLKVRAAPSLDTGSLRFQTLLAQRMVSFKQSWPINELVIDTVSQNVFEPQKIKSVENGCVLSKWNMNANSTQAMDRSFVDLIVDTSDHTRRIKHSNDEVKCCFCCCVTCMHCSGSVGSQP